MQLQLEACQEEKIWVIRCHNCEALNRPQEEYPARPLPIPPNCIDHLQSRLIKVQQGVWPPTLKKDSEDSLSTFSAHNLTENSAAR